MLLLSNVTISLVMFLVGRKHGQYFDKTKTAINDALTDSQDKLFETENELQSVIDKLSAITSVRTAKELKVHINDILDTSILAPSEESAVSNQPTGHSVSNQPKQ